VTSGRSSNTSRAYWELRAEQVMDRVFIPAMAAVSNETLNATDTATPAAATPAAPAEDDSIEVEVREAPQQAQPAHQPPQPAGRSGGWRRSPWAQPTWRPRRPLFNGPLFNGAWLASPWQIGGLAISPKLALACSGGLACLALGTSASLWLGWNQANQDLRQERTIRLLEGIRGLGSTDGSTASAASTTTKADQDGAATSADGLPPPPPTEPWIEDLGQLEGRGGGTSGGAAPLQVPVNGTLRAPAPVASASAAAPGPPGPPPPVPSGGGGSGGGATPELVGVVQIPGKPGSAIFQVGGSSTNATAGESIGSSGWRLVTTSGDSAVIERAGVSRRVSISSGF